MSCRAGDAWPASARLTRTRLPWSVAVHAEASCAVLGSPSQACLTRITPTTSPYTPPPRSMSRRPSPSPSGTWYAELRRQYVPTAARSWQHSNPAQLSPPALRADRHHQRRVPDQRHRLRCVQPHQHARCGGLALVSRVGWRESTGLPLPACPLASDYMLAQPLASAPTRCSLAPQAATRCGSSATAPASRTLSCAPSPPRCQTASPTSPPAATSHFTRTRSERGSG